eukprot:jgi/Picsp_1/5266/NSC_02628-R1_peptidase s8 s53 subtilisin kexin sedolisin
MLKIQAPDAWDLSTGNSGDGAVTVCVTDTGIDYNHPDLSANMHPTLRIGYNAITNSPDCMDSDGHGTHCAGVIAAATGNGQGVAGLNWNGRLIGCKFLGDTGGYTSDAIECLNWCVDQGATISSNSWGGGGYSVALYQAIQAAGARGHLFVAAAGNSGQNIDVSPEYPAGYDLDNIISVAASDSSDSLAAFSNYGSQRTDIAAPGVGVLSTVNGGGYASYSGTSMACPHVAGVAALVQAASSSTLSAYPAIKNLILQNSDQNIGSFVGKVASGARLNAFKAVQAVSGTPVLSPPPTVGISPPPAEPPAPEPPSSPPSIPLMPLSVSDLPFTSSNMDFASASTDAVSAFANLCPSYISDRLASASYRKHIYNISGLSNSGSITVDDCSMPNGVFDTVSAVVTCSPGLKECICYANDDGCGYAAGDSVSGVPLAAAKEYYSIVMPYASSRTSGVYKLTIRSPTGESPGPTPPESSLPAEPITVNGSWPYVTANLDIASGLVSPINLDYLNNCPAQCAEALTSSTRLKKIVKLTGLPSSGTVGADNCEMPSGKWDSISVLLDCAAGTTDCLCYGNDDGCAYAGGDRIQGLQLQSGRDYFSIVMPYSSSTTSGTYRLTVSGTGFPSTESPPPPPGSPPPPPGPPPPGSPPPPPGPPPPGSPPPPPGPPPPGSPPPPPGPPPPGSPPPPPSPPSPPPPSSPPPPQSETPPPFLAVPVSIGASRYASPTYNLGSGVAFVMSNTFARRCPRTARNRMQNGRFVKHIVELKDIPDQTRRYNVDGCLQPSGRWNSFSSLLICDPALTSCLCSANNDGCGRGAGGRIRRRSFNPTKRYFFVTFGVRRTDTGTYRVRFTS